MTRDEFEALEIGDVVSFGQSTYVVVGSGKYPISGEDFVRVCHASGHVMTIRNCVSDWKIKSKVLSRMNVQVKCGE